MKHLRRNEARRPRFWARLLIAASAAIVVVLSVSAPGLSAQGEGEFEDGEDAEFEAQYLDDDDIGQGTCAPSVVSAGTLTTCTWPLTGEGWETFNISSPYALIYEAPLSKSAPCRVEDAVLTCPDLLVPSWRGTFEVALDVYELEGRRAELVVDREFDTVAGLIRTVNRITTVFAGSDLSLELFRAGSLPDDATVEIHLRRPGSTEVVQRTVALVSGVEDGQFDLPIPESGRWEFVTCAVDQDGGCFRSGIPIALNAVDPSVVPVIAEHNNRDDTRIDMVFVGIGFSGVDDVIDSAKELLTIDGDPVPVDFDGEATTIDDEDLSDLIWGPFAVEPLRGRQDLFNFWAVEEVNTGSPIAVDNLFGPSLDLGPLGLGEHVVIINLDRWRGIDGFRANANMVSFAAESSIAFDDTVVPPPIEFPTTIDDIRFGSVFLPVAETGVIFDAPTLAHELGHALFGLRDEYVEFEQTAATLGRPNCVENEAAATAQWGDLVGELDPMYQRWRAAETEAGLWDDEFDATAEDLTVGLITGGCFAENTSAVRPTERSIMNDNIPVFGAVNRAWAERVLELFPEPTPVTTTTTTTTTTQAPTTTTSVVETAPPTSDVTAAAPSGDDAEASSESGGISPILIALGIFALVAGIAVGVAITRTRNTT